MGFASEFLHFRVNHIQNAIRECQRDKGKMEAERPQITEEGIICWGFVDQDQEEEEETKTGEYQLKRK